MFSWLIYSHSFSQFIYFVYLYTTHICVNLYTNTNIYNNIFFIVKKLFIIPYRIIKSEYNMRYKKYRYGIDMKKFEIDDKKRYKKNIKCTNERVLFF